MERAAARSWRLPSRRSRSRSREPTPGASASASCTALVCAVDGGCEERDSLDLAYGEELAARGARAMRPTSSTSAAARRCRSTSAAAARPAAPTAPTPRATIDRSRSGLPVTAFTRVVDRRRDGGALYLQYWFYYPGELHRRHRAHLRRRTGRASTRTTGRATRCGSRRAGAVTARATAHGGVRAAAGADSAGWYRAVGRQPRRAAGRGAARRARHAREEARAGAARAPRRHGALHVRGLPAVAEGRLHAPGVGELVSALTRIRGRAGGPRPCRRSGRPRAARCVAPPPSVGFASRKITIRCRPPTGS